MSQEWIMDGQSVIVQRKRIKNIYLRVLPDGALQVNAPMRTDDNRIRAFICDRQAWIARQRSRLSLLSAPCHYATGDAAPFFGETLMLLVEPHTGRAGVKRSGGTLVMRIAPDADEAARKRALDAWYRIELRKRAETLLPICESTVGKRAGALTIRDMTTRWGSCNCKTARITLNLRLVEKPPACLQYVITHELCHLYEANHSERFWARMDGYYPDWRRVRKLLRG